MARPLRIQFENAYYHVMCRGNAGQQIFSNDQDRSSFLRLLQRSSDMYQVPVLAYVLMQNHFHLLVTTPLANLQEFMRHFNISYTSYYNRTYHRAGHLYQGRYRSSLIDADSYLLEVSRYVHLNPVRIAEMADRPVGEKRARLRAYPWSSYPGYISSRKRLPFISYEIMAQFGRDAREASASYARFVERGLSRDLDNPLDKGIGHGIVGDEPFITHLRDTAVGGKDTRELPAAKAMRRVPVERILEVVCRLVGVDREELFRRRARTVGRGLLIETLSRYGGLNQREIGVLLGMDYSSVSVGRKRFQELLEKDASLQARTDAIRGELYQW